MFIANLFYPIKSGFWALLLLSAGGLCYVPVRAQEQAGELPPPLEISYGAGPLQLTGSATDGKVRWTVPGSWGKGKDSLLVYRTYAKQSLLFLRPGAREQLKDNKEVLAVTLPPRQQLELRSAKGAVHVNKLQGRFRAELESGPVTVEELQGSLFAHTGDGSVTVRSSNATGSVSTGKGDVLIENTEGEIAGFSREGKVVTRFTKAYVQAKTSPLQLSLAETALEVEALPAGGTLQVRKGSVLVKDAPKGILVRTEEGDITLEKAAGTVNASSRKGSLTCTLQGGLTDGDLYTEGGNVTVTLPASFAGTIYLEHEQNDANKGTYQVKSDFDLGTFAAEPLKGPQGQTFALVTRLEKSFGTGTGKAIVRIRAVNGNITILKK